MKKTILLLAAISMFTYANAESETDSVVVDLDSGQYTCSGKAITYNTEESTLKASCKDYSIKKQRTSTSNKNLDDENHVTNLSRVHFTTDNGTRLQCYYQNKKLKKCKLSQWRNEG